MADIVSADFNTASFDGVCLGCGCEGNHAAGCAAWVKEVAGRVSDDEAARRLEFSRTFWCGGEMPSVTFWEAVIRERERKPDAANLERVPDGEGTVSEPEVDADSGCEVPRY